MRDVETATVICWICGRPLPVEDSVCNAGGQPVHQLCFAAEVVTASRSVPTPNFKRQLVSARPRLIVKSTCLKCWAFTVGRYDDGYINKWQREHNCHARPNRVTLLDRLRAWLSHRMPQGEFIPVTTGNSSPAQIEQALSHAVGPMGGALRASSSACVFGLLFTGLGQVRPERLSACSKRQVVSQRQEAHHHHNAAALAPLAEAPPLPLRVAATASLGGAQPASESVNATRGEKCCCCARTTHRAPAQKG